MSAVVGYIIGADRNNPDEARAHYYARTKAGHYWPMCDYAWNRSDGAAFSILRGHSSARGICKLCEKNIDDNRRPVINPRPHKTKWI